MLIQQSQIAADPWVASLLVAGIGAAAAAVAGAVRIILSRSPRRCIVPFACLLVAMTYIAMTLDSGLDVRWHTFGLISMGLVNLVIIEFCSVRKSSACSHRGRGKHGNCP